MAHFAEVVDGVVQRVIVAENVEWCEANLGGTWVQTSYNTLAGKHALGGTPLHKNYAGIGSIFDGVGFHAPQPFPSWTLDEETYVWEPPTAMPLDGKRYDWNETDLMWEEVIPPTE
jgi:hypothetical protein